MSKSTILLVEDDRSVAAGLTRALEVSSFDVVTVHDAPDAVRAMGQRSFEVIVLDIGLPSLDGLTLLSHLRKRQMNKPVLVISGRLGRERADIVRGLKATCLQKPFTPDVFAWHVRKLIDPDAAMPAAAPERVDTGSSATHEAVSTTTPEERFAESFRQKVAALSSADDAALPLLDRRLARAHALLTSGDPSCAQIAELIESDPRVVAGVLSAANSAVFGCKDRVTEVSVAVARIGTAEVLKIVMTCLVSTAFGGGATEHRVLIQRSWKRSVLAARLASHLASAHGQNEGEVYTVALLQDIGELAGFSMAGAALASIQASPEESIVWVENEVKRYHARLGANLLSRWGLPQPLPFAAANHHQRVAETDTLLRLTNGAHELVEIVQRGEIPTASVLAADAPALERLSELVLEWSKDLS